MQAGLLPHEKLFAFLDDIYIVTAPNRTADSVENCSGMRAFHSTLGCKTQIWNRAGRMPPACADILAAARVTDPTAVVWKVDLALPSDQQGLVVLGAPIGHPDFVMSKLEEKSHEHRVLLERIPAIEDIQCAWLFLLFCAAVRANYFLRVVQPALSARFATAHDNDIWRCCCQLMDIEDTDRSRQLSSLPGPEGLHIGPVGLTLSRGSGKGIHQCPTRWS